jgi:hypothetical protein
MTDLYAILTPIGETTMPKITNEEEALAAVRRDGRVLERVPEKYKKAELCLKAMRQDSRALQFVPELLRDEVRAKLKNGDSR